MRVGPACRPATAGPRPTGPIRFALTLLLAAVAPLFGATPDFQQIRSFGGTEASTGFGPGALTRGTDGELYGILNRGGPAGAGALFRLANGGTETVLIHTFTADATQGRAPHGTLVEGTDGRLYGTAHGGTNNQGILFGVDRQGGNFAVLRHATNVIRSLVASRDGRLYFIEGDIARIEVSGANHTVISTLQADLLLEGVDGLLYAASASEPAIRRLTRDGGELTDIVTFFPPDNLGLRLGEISHLAQGSDGRLYGLGAELSGGTGYYFRVATNGSGFAQTRFSGASRFFGATTFLSSSQGEFFLSGSGSAGFRGGLYRMKETLTGDFATNVVDWPALTGGEFGGLTLDRIAEGADGRIYGSTDYGGSQFAGLLFRVERDGSNFTVLRQFAAAGEADGTNAAPTLAAGTDGRLYGTTRGGGSGNRGTVYRVAADGSGYQVIKRFATDAEGAEPAGGVVDGRDGFLYGVTLQGGSQGLGTLFKLRHDGSSFAVLYNMRSNRPAATPQDPTLCFSQLLSDDDGWLYGVGSAGGSANRGGIFRARKDGSLFTNIHNFVVGEARRPFASLVKGQDGRLYGTTEFGGANDLGTLFRLNPDGSGFAIVRAFGAAGDGGQPIGPLWQDTNGVFYGNTFGGGTNNLGTLFRINPDGSGYALLRHFGNAGDGRRPNGALVSAPDGSLLGVTRFGGSGPVGSQWGTLYRIDRSGTGYEILRSFTAISPDGGGVINGLTASPSSPGVFLGTTSFGGTQAGGTLFRLAYPTAPPEPLALATPPGPNVTVPCGSPYLFTQPTYAGGCAPVVIASNLVVTGSGCTQTRTMTWTVTDACGQSLTNSQSIALEAIAPTLEAATVDADGKVSVPVQVAPNVRVIVERRENLDTAPWVPVATNIGSFLFLDPSPAPGPAVSPQRFYRAVITPRP